MEPTEAQLRIIRALIPDTEEVFGENDNETMFSNQDLGDYFTAGRGSTLRAAGFAKLAIGTSEALISKVIRTQDLQTNGATLADSFVKQANALFDQADKEDMSAALDFFEIVDYRQGWYAERPELTEWQSF